MPAPFLVVISIAYNLPFQTSQLSGGPAWIRSNEDTYDIEAKSEAGSLQGLSARARADKMRVMLQTLLAEGFKLAIRRETKDLPVYTLSVGKNGAKLQKSKLQEEDCSDDSKVVIRLKAVRVAESIRKQSIYRIWSC